MSYYTNVLEYLEISAKEYPNKIAFSDEKLSISFSELKNYSMSLGTGIIKKLIEA